MAVTSIVTRIRRAFSVLGHTLRASFDLRAGMLFCVFWLAILFLLIWVAFLIPRTEAAGICVMFSLFYLVAAPASKRRRAFLIFASFLALLIASVQWDEHVFNTMTPAQHLAGAKKAQSEKAELSLSEGLSHTAAIPANAPEKAEANAIAEDLEARLRDLREAKQASQQARKAQIETVPELESQLKNLGYDVKVTDDGKTRTEIIIVSSDFSDTDRRVKFLEFLRGHNGPAAELLCVRGFQTVRLRTPLHSFSEPYSLECYGSR